MVSDSLIAELKERANRYFRAAEILLEAARILDGEAHPLEGEVPEEAVREETDHDVKPKVIRAPKRKLSPPAASTKRDTLVEYLTRKGPTCLGDIAKDLGSINSRVSVMLA